MTQQYLANVTKDILKKYENVNSVKTIDNIEVVTVDKQDLDFLLGYTMESLRIETEYREEIEQIRGESGRRETMLIKIRMILEETK